MDEPSLKIAMKCSDLGASRAFYGGALGLELVDEWEEGHGNGCIYAVGSGFIELNEPARADGEDAASDHRFNLQIKVADLDAWLAHLDGRWEHDEPKTQPWGERTVRMRDPDGTLVTIYQEIGT